jgi:dTDP-4-amino-4,6-dideoxygalactose transaminase
MAGAVLRVKLRYLEGWTEARRAAAARYDALFAAAGLATPMASPGNRHVYHLYVIRTDRRAALQEGLAACGIQTGIHYPTPVHLLPAFAELGHRVGDFPHAEQAAQQVLSLPMFPELTAAQTAEVAQAVISIGGAALATPAAPTPPATPQEALTSLA